MKKIISFTLVVLLIANFSFADFDLKKFYVFPIDISDEDLSGYDNLAEVMEFSNQVIFPPADRLPDGFDPIELIDWASSKSLGIEKLHDAGYTGKGVKIAYIDQPISVEHIEMGGNFENAHIHNMLLGWDDSEKDKHYHGNLVSSIIIGKDIGIAPEVELYFIGHPAWLGDQRTHAAAIHKIIDINRDLPVDEKIRIIGFSDSVDLREQYHQAFAEAIKAAEESGVMVFTCADNIHQGQFYPMSNRADFKNVFPVGRLARPLALLIPTTNTCPGVEGKNVRIYCPSGGYSSATPFMVGLAAIGLQINSKLSKDDIVLLMEWSSYPPGKNAKKMRGIINPLGFVRAVESTVDSRSATFLIHNSEKMSAGDIAALAEYASNINTSENRVILLDVNVKYMSNVYKFVKNYAKLCSSAVSAVQVIGGVKEVPLLVSDEADAEQNGLIINSDGEKVAFNRYSLAEISSAGFIKFKGARATTPIAQFRKGTSTYIDLCEDKNHLSSEANLESNELTIQSQHNTSIVDVASTKSVSLTSPEIVANPMRNLLGGVLIFGIVLIVFSKFKDKR